MMFTRIRAAVLTAGSTVAVPAAGAPSAHAGLLSLATGPCGQHEDQPFAQCFFVRNTGSSASRLNVYATYPLLLGIPFHAYLGQVSGSGAWQPSSPVQIRLLNNTLGSPTLGESTISFKFVPAESSGKWQIDDVYLDPFHRC
jgi:hypothetical protein